MFLPPIERPKGLSMKIGYRLMSKPELVENKTLRQGVTTLIYALAK